MNSRQLMASLARKTLVFIAMMFLLSLIVFYVSRLTPGDPLQSFYGDAMQSMTTTELDAARERLGLNGPIWMQYAKWIGNVMQGDFGISLKYKRPVLDVVSPLIGNTLMLGGIAYALVFMLAIALALFCARFEDTFMDRFVCRIGTVAFYVAAFWMGAWCWCSFSASTSNCCRAAVPTGSGNPAIWPTACATSSCRSSSWWRATCGITLT